MANEARALLEALEAAWAEGKATAVATVVRVIGSAYRREGAKMLVREDGVSVCMISGGCLEQEMIERAMQMLARGRPERTVFDYAEDKTWWPGCGGTVEVWVEPVDGQSLLYRWLLESTEAEPSVLATVLSGGEGRLWLRPDGRVEGQIAPPELQAQVLRIAQQMQRVTSRPTTRYVEEAEVFFDVSSPIPELVLFGAGHDARPMAHQALVLGFRVTVVDARPELLEGFEGCQTVEASPEEFERKVRLTPRHHVIVMNHQLEIDRKALRFALASPARYVGVLGPRSRLERMLEALAAEGFVPTAEQLARLRNPIGVDIGAESPEEIALSALAEIVALRRGFGGGFLNDKKAGIHQPERVLTP
ncbi:XdhC/CoxI family protein [Meiothermus sp. QL-1]|uniref:XdhC family protein n=1 Tax=Meiothermus sp. QL-1 TaxID=2058095 RepID=UPI000E0B1D5A|nr:XdhC/CoxI family protein [Meiothermus sp. QL-1]RDI94668.1 XdhC/CoxI family protein [Meiothermus sp. QL-1]